MVNDKDNIKEGFVFGEPYPCLQVITPAGGGKRFKIQEPCILGRSSDCDFVIEDNKISRYHLIVRPIKSGLIVRDLGSKNGVFLNGKRIMDDEWVKHGDVLLLGETFLSVDYPQSMAAERGGSHFLVTISTAAISLFDEISIPDHVRTDMLTPDDFHAIQDILTLSREKGEETPHFRSVTKHLMGLFHADSAVFCLARLDDYEPIVIFSKEKKTLFLSEILQSTLMQRKGVLIHNIFDRMEKGDSTKIPRDMPASQMAVPFIHEGKIVGLIALGAKRPNVFSKNALTFLTVLANYLAPSVASTCMQAIIAPSSAASHKYSDNAFIGSSDAIAKLQKLIEQVAAQPVNILITGETGTGKEIVARIIHEKSGVSDGPFIAVNCSSIPPELFEAEVFGHEKGAFTGAYRSKPGKFELAQDGTIFFDEIGELPLFMQAKLLRVLESREFMRVGGTQTLYTNARFLFATNKNLPTMVKQGQFREDLFFRINTIEIAVPPLRERLEDIPELAEHFLDDIQIALRRPNNFRFSSAVLSSFLAYTWPGNVRELRNVLEQMAVLTEEDLIDEQHLPDRIRVQTSFPEREGLSKSGGLLSSVTDLTQKQMILHALDEANGQKKKAAEILGISRPTLDKKLRIFGINK